MSRFKFRNKEISWLSFNERVLQEARNKEVPVIERLKFLGIYSNNLDEFFRVRVATLKRLSQLGKQAKSYLEEEPDETLKIISSIVSKHQILFQEIYKEIRIDLSKEKIFIVNETELTPEQEEFVLAYFIKNVRPRIFPIIIDKKTDISDLKNDMIYLAIDLVDENNIDNEIAAVVKVPTDTLARFIIIPGPDDNEYIILLDDIMRLGLPGIFKVFGLVMNGAYTIKMTRNAELDIDDDLGKSYVQKISRSLSQRKAGEPVRFIYDREMPEPLFKTIARLLNIHKSDTSVAGGRYHNFKDFMKFPKVGKKNLRFDKWPTIDHPDIKKGVSILSSIRENDIMLFFPYHSFGNIVDLLREAALDPKTDSIYITIYRVAQNSTIMNSLINASKNGKNVTVVLELQARFDEELNIYWSKKLRDVGARVILGVPGLKVHSKLILISRKEDKELFYYSGISTGNFNEITSKVFSDTILLTANKDITSEVKKVFDFFNRNYEITEFNHLLVSPFNTRKNLVRLINQEIQQAKKGNKAEIFIKVNNLADHSIILKLYEAHKAGVNVKLIVRAMFSLIPYIPEKSIDMECIGVIDRYLEHSRIMYFYNGGKEKIYISSSDLMERNLDRRVEVTCPIYDKKIISELKKTMEILWRDNTQARILDNDLSNKYRVTNETEKIQSQYEIYKFLSTLPG